MPMTIGQLAREANVNIETIRYYERRDLVPAPPRKNSGYRAYPMEALDRLLFIRHAKELGFSLEEIRELLLLRVDARTSCGEVKRRADSKIADIKQKIKELHQIKQALVRLAATCQGRGPTSACPILDALETKRNGYNRRR